MFEVVPVTRKCDVIGCSNYALLAVIDEQELPHFYYCVGHRDRANKKAEEMRKEYFDKYRTET